MKQRLWVSAFEPSADQYLADVLSEIRSQKLNIEVNGIGGPLSRKAGLKPLFHAEELSVMGLVEILKSLPKIISKRQQIIKYLKQNPPEVALLIDYPGLHFSLFKPLKRLGTRIVYYIPPKVWVWRKSRIQTLKKYVDRILCIFSFEKDFFESEGLTVEYVGNPLMEQLPLKLTKAEAREKLGLPTNREVLVVMPGSRRQEIEFHLDVMLATALRFEKETGAMIYFSLPESMKEFASRLKDVRVGYGDAHIAMKAGDFGLIKSGTSTLEAALLGLRHIVVYRLNPFTCFLLKHVFRMNAHAGLSNLMLDSKSERKPTFRERLCSDVTEHQLLASLLELQQPMVIDHQSLALTEISERMKINGSPKELVTEVLVQELKNGSSTSKQFSWTKFFAAHAWSGIHSLRLFFSRPTQIKPKVISVGNFQMGGSGKTPFVLELLREAESLKKKVWVLTRGYRSNNESRGGVIVSDSVNVSANVFGDEAIVIHRAYPEVPIGVGVNRLASYEKLRWELGYEPDWVILDDGGQNLQIKKDLDIILLTSDRVGEVWFRQIPKIREGQFYIWSKGVKTPEVFSQRSARIPRLDIETVFKNKMPEKTAYLVSGIANPDSLRHSLEQSGVMVKTHRIFKDHESWTNEEIALFFKEASTQDSVVVMTTKDYARLPERFHQENIVVVDSQVKWMYGKAELMEKLR